MLKKRVRTGPKYDNIMGIKVTSTSRERLLENIQYKLDEGDRFYIVTPNPEMVLLAQKDWYFKKVLSRADFAVPDGIGLAQAHRFLNLDYPKNKIIRAPYIFIQGLIVGLMTLVNKDWVTEDLKIIKGRELFIDLMEIANQRKLRVYLFGGEHGESEAAKKVLERKYPNVVFKTHYQFPMYNNKALPVSEVDRLLHLKILGSIKIFEPDLVFVALNAPKQEKWIYNNFFNFKASGAMACGGTYNFVAGISKVPPKFMANLGIEWLWRIFTEPVKGKRLKRLKRVFMSFPVFPIKIFLYKLFK